ncbi:MAG TPA: RpiB/LacA/LacB family sugar-phosphate isomerase [Bacilli bacterium]|jgi:ribose 5-phosphate isomerase B|nr:RpiB/LacA/LacB family sugar-phosphate isomerase [Bacilli bacterium]HPZ23266.1 RpiB/LacA/LacB family sugar-phosphate isomerase [Bacilli bacterium]HQC83283.1 RpiB/LacA/LacB family sugar-phosphate isomerase [Bacilli bacterium]
MRIAIATDHNGVEQKKELIKYLEGLDYKIVDLSPNNTPVDDYPDYAKKVCDYVVNNEADYGILMCGTGIGMSIAANKVHGIRAAKVSNTNEAFLTRNDNDANVLTMSYREPLEDIKNISKVFLETPYSNEERHTRRIKKVMEMDNEY